MNKNLCNLLSTIINGQKKNKKSILQKKSKYCKNILNLLWDTGFILGYRIYKKNSNYFEIFLKYKNEQPVIKKITILSKPTKSIYLSIKNIWNFDLKLGELIISTNNGIKTIEQCKNLKLGGKALFIIN